MDTTHNQQDSQKYPDYLLLIQAKIYGWSGKIADKAERLELSTQIVTRLMNGCAEGFSLSQLIAIARKAGLVSILSQELPIKRLRPVALKVAFQSFQGF